jgi:hypothetical protein
MKLNKINKNICIFMAGIFVTMVIILVYIKISEREYVSLAKQFYNQYTTLAETLISADSIEDALILLKEDSNKKVIIEIELTISLLQTKTPAWKNPFYIDMEDRLSKLLHMVECADIPYEDLESNKKSSIRNFMYTMRMDVNDWKDNKYNRAFW